MLKAYVKNKLKNQPALTDFARDSYRLMKRGYRCICRVPVLGSIVQSIAAIPSVPRDLQTMRQGMSKVDQVSEHLPTLLNALDAAEANFRKFQRTNDELARELRVIEERLSRIEKAAGPEQDDALPKEMDAVRNSAKLAAMSSNLRVNLTIGNGLLDDYINVSPRELPGMDVIAPVDKLPFILESVEEIRSVHLLERYPNETLSDVILPHWLGLLKRNGRLVAIVPDWIATIDAYLKTPQECPFEQLRQTTFGEGGDFHYNAFSRENLKQLLEKAGYHQIDFQDADRKDSHSFDMVVTAVKE